MAWCAVLVFISTALIELLGIWWALVQIKPGQAMVGSRAPVSTGCSGNRYSSKLQGDSLGRSYAGCLNPASFPWAQVGGGTQFPCLQHEVGGIETRKVCPSCKILLP